MTIIDDVEYPLRLCVEMIYYSFWLNERTETKTIEEFKEHLTFFFSEAEIEESLLILSGKLNKSTLRYD